MPIASATITGTVTGRIRMVDPRPIAADGSATTPTAGAGFVAVPRVVVAVTAIPQDSDGELNVVNPTFFAVTDGAGNFSSPWRDRSRDAFPTRVRVQVLWTSTRGAGGDTTAPARLFRVARFDDVAPGGSTFIRTVGDPTRALGNLGAGASDESAAYLTTQEFFRRVVRFSRRLRNRMPGLTVKTRVPGFGMFFGVTPSRREAFVSAGTPVSAPLVLAHELGHAATWAALDLDNAPINPASDYAHPRGTPFEWRRTSREFSKAAFLEGLADAWALEWGFGSDANVVLTIGGSTFRFEAGRVTGTDAMRCRTVGDAHEFPFCNTVALRDLLDPGGPDGINMTRAGIVNILNRFPNGCVRNGCRDEPGLDGLNHHDFRCNARGAGLRARIRAVWRGNRINGGPASSCAR